MPAMTQLHRITSEEVLLEKLRTYFDYARKLMYDERAGLFFREAKYVYPKHKSPPHFPALWSSHELPQRLSPQKQFLSNYCIYSVALCVPELRWWDAVDFLEDA